MKSLTLFKRGRWSVDCGLVDYLETKTPSDSSIWPLISFWHRRNITYPPTVRGRMEIVVNVYAIQFLYLFLSLTSVDTKEI